LTNAGASSVQPTSIINLLIYNDEGNIGILDVSFGSKMAGIFEEDLLLSAKIDEMIWHRRPFLEKLKEHFFALFRKRL